MLCRCDSGIPNYVTRAPLRPPYRLFLVFLFVAQGSSAFGQLCPGVVDPCVISTSQTIASGTVLDIGSRSLVMASGATLTVSGAGLFFINARNVTLQANAKILADGELGFGGTVFISALGAVTLDPGSRIDVQAAFGGDIDITADSLLMNGQLKASATSRDGDGGLIDVTTTFDTTIGGLGIQASGGDRFSSGGLIDVIAGGNILVDALIEAKGGDGDGGDIDLDALGDVTTTVNGELNNIATLVFGSGGFTTITGGRAVTIGGLIFSRGQGNYLEGGGDGGDLDILADGGDVVINGRIEIDGSAPDGSGGFMDVFASGAIFLNDDITLTGGREGGGGDLLIEAGDVTFNGAVDLRAGFIGGAVDVFTGGSVVFTPLADLDASTNDGPVGQFGGIVDALACDIEVQAGARLLAVGNGTPPRATIRLRASSNLTVAGTIQAGALVELRVRDSAPVFVPGSIIDPSPSIVVDPALPCCVNCPTTTTTTSTSLPTTTSTSLPTTTSTSLQTTTTTSSPTTSSVATSSTSTTTVSSTTTSTVDVPSTTTTTVVESSTTTTTLPLSCLDEPLEGLDAVECPITLLQGDLALVSDDELGGRKARGLRKRVEKAAAFVDRARLEENPKRVVRFLKKASRKVTSFDRKLERFVAKSKITDEIAAPLRDRASVARSRLDSLQVLLQAP